MKTQLKTIRLCLQDCNAARHRRLLCCPIKILKTIIKSGCGRLKVRGG